MEYAQQYQAAQPVAATQEPVAQQPVMAQQPVLTQTAAPQPAAPERNGLGVPAFLRRPTRK